jgi:hypothetical protein
MILSLGQGEPSYVPDGLVGQARDSADVSYLAFLQCYARDLTQWELICYFSDHQESWCSLAVMAQELGLLSDELDQKLVCLANARLLEQRVAVTGPEYRLTRSAQLRRLVVRVGSQWRWTAMQAG